MNFLILLAEAALPPEGEDLGTWAKFIGWISSLWTAFSDWLRETLGPPLKSLHEPIDNWLGSLPMSVAVGSAIGLFVIAGIWVWTLKREFIFRGAPDQMWWRDLRLWSMVVLLPYIMVYLLLGR